MKNFFLKIGSLKKYFFGNVIAFLGYAVFVFLVHYFLIVRPSQMAIDKEIIEKYGENLMSGLYEGLFSLIYMFSIIVFLVLLLIEFLIRKNFKPKFFKSISISENILKIYNILFWFGLLFTILPLLDIISFLLSITINYFRIF